MPAGWEPRCPPPSPLFTVKPHHKMLLGLAVTVKAAVAADSHSPGMVSKTERLPQRGPHRHWFLFKKKKVPRREVSSARAARTVMKSAGLGGAIPEQNGKHFGHHEEGRGASSYLFCLLSCPDEGET